MICNKRAPQYFPLCPQALDVTPFLRELTRTAQDTNVCKGRKNEILGYSTVLKLWNSKMSS